MSRSKARPSVLVTGITLIVVGLLSCDARRIPRTPSSPPGPVSHADLVQLFEEWRAFEMPEFVDGVPDYSAAAMAGQQAELPQWQARLNALAPENWPIEEQIDWHLVRAEMNGSTSTTACAVPGRAIRPSTSSCSWRRATSRPMKAP